MIALPNASLAGKMQQAGVVVHPGPSNQSDRRRIVMAEYIVVDGIDLAKSFAPEQFGRLTTLGPAFRLPIGKKGQRATSVVCRCECGEVGVYLQNNIRKGHARSCGCFQSDSTAKRATRHGCRRPGKTTPEYQTWCVMLARCKNPQNPRYADYGGRGIKVCDRWAQFENFLADMVQKPSPKHSIERIDNDGDYCPENCKWATTEEQANNKRCNRTITMLGETKTMAQWAKQFGISDTNIWQRIEVLGWSEQKAVTKPVRKCRAKL